MASDPRVLVVEDSDDLRMLYALILEQSDLECELVRDGREALDALHARPGDPWVVLLDLEMPRMDGASFLASKRRDPALADIPVIVVSAVVDVRTPPMGADVRAVLTKPVPFAALLRLIRSGPDASPAGRPAGDAGTMRLSKPH